MGMGGWAAGHLVAACAGGRGSAGGRSAGEVAAAGQGGQGGQGGP